MIEDFKKLMDSVKVLATDLSNKIQEYTVGMTANKNKADALVVLETELKAAQQKLADDRASIAGILDVEAQRLQNETDAKNNVTWVTNRKAELSKIKENVDADLKTISRDKADLEARERQLTKDLKQLADDKATYKEKILKDLGKA